MTSNGTIHATPSSGSPSSRPPFDGSGPASPTTGSSSRRRSTVTTTGSGTDGTSFTTVASLMEGLDVVTLDPSWGLIARVDGFFGHPTPIVHNDSGVPPSLRAVWTVTPTAGVAAAPSRGR